MDGCVSSMVVKDIDIDWRWEIWCSGCRWKKRTRGWTRKVEATRSGCYVVVVEGGRRPMGPEKQLN